MSFVLKRFGESFHSPYTNVITLWSKLLYTFRILASIRVQSQIALVVTSSRISAILLEGGRTGRFSFEQQFTPEIYNSALDMIANIRVLKTNEPFIKLGMSSLDRLATDLVKNDMRREQQFNTTDLASLVKINERLFLNIQKAFYFCYCDKG